MPNSSTLTPQAFLQLRMPQFMCNNHDSKHKEKATIVVSALILGITTFEPASSPAITAIMASKNMPAWQQSQPLKAVPTVENVIFID